MIKYHDTTNGNKIAEVLPEVGIVATPEEMLDIMVNAGYNGCQGVIINTANILPDFFVLKTGVAGKILQKYSNYRMKLAIVGVFTEIEHKSLRDFIRESNERGIVCFVESLEMALTKLSK